ncbi:MAG: nicotinic acid mononucleotide adenylyltransferase, partial [Riemerella sp.]
MKKIGLFFGSFNPIHIGHLILANYIVEHTDLDELWFV